MMDAWFATKEVDENVFAIAEDRHWERVRSYLFRGEDVSWLVDTGTGIGDIHALVRSLTGGPVHVVSTHAHWDHIGGHDRFDAVHIHAADADWLQHGLPLPIDQIRTQIAKEPFEIPARSGFVLESYRPPHVAAPQIVREGDLLESADFTLQVLHTPGHSPGSICLWEPNRRLLATGDLVYRGTVYADYPSTDPKAVLASYRKLARLNGVHRLLPGHNDSSLPPEYISHGLRLLESLEQRGALCRGSGLHQGTDVSFRF